MVTADPHRAAPARPLHPKQVGRSPRTRTRASPPPLGLGTRCARQSARADRRSQWRTVRRCAATRTFGSLANSPHLGHLIETADDARLEHTVLLPRGQLQLLSRPTPTCHEPNHRTQAQHAVSEPGGRIWRLLHPSNRARNRCRGPRRAVPVSCRPSVFSWPSWGTRRSRRARRST